MTLSIKELITAQDVLAAAFERRELEKLLLDELGYDVATEIGVGGAYERVLFDVFNGLGSDARIAELIAKAAAKRPDHAELQALAARAAG